MLKKLTILSLLVIQFTSLYGQVALFTDKTSSFIPGIDGITDGSLSWADYDNDNDLDFILTGFVSTSTVQTDICQIWQNGTKGTSGIFTNKTAFAAPDFPQLFQAGVSWGDYDNDNDLDILMTGSLNDDYTCQIWINDISNSGKFVKAETNLPNLFYVKASWGDYDSDGDLDIIAAGGIDASHFFCSIWRNDGHNVFTDVQSNFPGLAFYPSMVFGDYDNDGDKDIALSGVTLNNNNNHSRVTDIWRNDGGIFIQLHSGLTLANGGAIDWGDYDSDGDLDILLAGHNGTEEFCEVWRNDNGLFTNIHASLPTIGSDAQWADLDNDGDLDILLSGYSDSSIEKGTFIFTNTNGTFVSTILNINVPGVVQSGDFDNDHDLDVYLLEIRIHTSSEMSIQFLI